ncbi:unnamed protein product [Fraxinus pennsylvanica]|uniref:RRM domain-containing protein n=1 Tax=Fraxinus pennsylvanica TaxID=56036 RepID=A0AAD1ZI36_9LAMI|nr:unnamed protein product [Fraxinus pennsylvanica]
MAENETLVDPHPSKEEEATHGNEEHMPDVQKPSDYSYSESDSDSDDETQAKAQTEAVELELYNNPSNYDAHVRYIKLLRKQGDIDKLRQAREAMSALFPLSPDMWRNWAKDEITMCSGIVKPNKNPSFLYEVVDDWVTPRLQELQLFKLQQENKTVGAPTHERENPVRKNAREKRKPVSSSMDEQPPAKRRKDLDQKNKKAYGNDRGQGRHLDEANEVALVHDSKADSVSTKETKNHSPIKPVIYNDKCTAFISNLSLQATDKDLRSFFSDVGGVVAIRILTDQDKRSRGLAYVDFSDDAYLAAAVEKNKQSLLGKRLGIARSDPQRGRGEKTAGCSSKFDRGTADNRRSNAGETAETSGVRRGPQATICQSEAWG